MSGALTYRAMHVSSGDLVLRDRELARVTACTQDGSGQLGILAELWECVAQLTPQARRWQRADFDHQEVWPASEIEPAVAWYQEGDCLIVLDN